MQVRMVKESQQTDSTSKGNAEPYAPELDAVEKEEVERRTAVSADVVHEAIRKEGQDELERAPAALAWSGLAAGLSMGFSLVTQGLLRAHLPDTAWRPLVANLGYCIGFLIVVLGRQQLFTENTLTVIIPLMSRRDRKTLGAVIRLWAVVLAANLFGALIFAAVVAFSGIFDTPTMNAFAALSREAVHSPAGIIIVKGIFAGWLIALMVWLLPVAETNSVAVIIIITYVVGLGNFAHVVAGGIEVLYGAMTGTIGWASCIAAYILPALLGNILGGVSLVAALNHAQVVAGRGSGESSPSPAHR